MLLYQCVLSHHDSFGAAEVPEAFARDILEQRGGALVQLQTPSCLDQAMAQTSPV